MPAFFENLGIDFLLEEDEILNNFIGYLTHTGKQISGYYEYPAFFKPLGDIDVFVKTQLNENGTLDVVGFDTHCCGRNIWTLRNTGIDITPEDSLKTDRVFMFNDCEDGNGILPIHLINADVLPSFLEDDIVTMQMCAFPLSINYYADEEDYADDQPADEDGRHWLISDGSLLPMHFLSNHADSSEESDYSTDDYVSFKGTVTRLQHGVFEVDGKKENMYIRCYIDTPYGELHFAHTIDQIAPEQVDNVKVGSIISGVCILSGDVAIREYENGISKTYDNAIRVLRQALAKGEADRLFPVLTENTVYISDAAQKTYIGAQEIIERLNYVYNSRKNECHTTPATIFRLESDDLEYPVGTRCFLVSYNSEDNYDAIVFTDVDDDGNIRKIHVCEDSRYGFQIDKKAPAASLSDDIKLPESVIEPIYSRAHYFHFIDDDITIADIEAAISQKSVYKEAAEYMLTELKEHPQHDAEKTLANIFGYLFAKTVELTIHNDSLAFSKENYVILDAIEGKIPTDPDNKQHNKIAQLLEKATPFFNDFSFFIQLGEPDDDRFMKELTTALMAVQHIGYLFATGLPW